VETSAIRLIMGDLDARQAYFERKLSAMLLPIASLALSLLALTAAACAPPNKPLAAGDVAPEFSLVGSDGKPHRLSDHRGKFVVVAWFPKAFTGG